jgi:hypothetical protein
VEVVAAPTTTYAMSGLAPIAAVMLQCHDRSKSADSVAKVGGMAALIYRRCFLSLFLICEA